MKRILCIMFFVSTNVSAQKVEHVLPKTFNQFPNVRDFAMDKEKTEIYFTVESYKKGYSFIGVVKKEKNGWGEPKVASFSGQYKDLEPFLSPDELTLYFASNRKDNTSSEAKKDIDIWYVTRKSKKDPWSKPINIGAPINTSVNEFYPSVNKKGDLFFTAQYKDSKGKEDIYVSRFVNGKYTKPISLGNAINSEKYEFNAYVSPDEDFIIFTSYGRKDGFGGGDLYISRKDEKGNWLPAKNLGNTINSNKIDYCPFVDLSTNTLYFTSDKNNIKPVFTDKKEIRDILKKMNTFPNGLSRIYKASLTKK